MKKTLAESSKEISVLFPEEQEKNVIFKYLDWLLDAVCLTTREKFAKNLRNHYPNEKEQNDDSKSTIRKTWERVGENLIKASKEKGVEQSNQDASEKTNHLVIDIDLTNLDEIKKEFKRGVRVLLERKEISTPSTNWTTLHFSFASEQVQQWTNHNFTYNQCKEWLDAGLQPTEADFATYLRDFKHLTSEEVLNHGNYEQLKKEYRVYQEQIQTQQEQSLSCLESKIEIPPKRDL